MIFLTKRDTISSLITGLMTGFVAWQISLFLGKPEFFSVPAGALVVIIPLCWLAGVWFGHFVGQWINFFHQFGRFVATGFTNAAVDFGVLYLLIGISGLGREGFYYTFFKSISFIVAVFNSYFWNKFWVFEAQTSGGGRGEFAKFFGVTLITFFINVGVASFIVNLIEPFGGISPEGWAGIGAVIGATFGLTFSFVGFRVVFKK